MLSPAYDLSQNDDNFIISIQVPYAKVSDFEVQFENNSFMFSCEPYYLRLNLPGKVMWVEEPLVAYDAEKKQFKVQAPKKIKGEVFQNLDSDACLFVPKKSHFLPDMGVNRSDDDDYNIILPKDRFGTLSIFGQECGFSNSYSFSVFDLKDETSEIFDIEEPQNKSLKVRQKERLAKENKDFDEEHYLADKYNDEEIQELLRYMPEWETLFEKYQDCSPVPVEYDIVFNKEEREALEKLPVKDYSINPNQIQQVSLGLLDILFAYCYNKRITEGENTVESAWTINKLSASLSWLEVFSSVEDVAISCIRRSLIYPLYRHFELSLTILEDVRKILLLGRKYIAKCFLEVHELFSQTDPRYILNDLFITDYILWALSSSCSSESFARLAKKLNNTLLTKGEIGLNLVDIEMLAMVAWNNRELFQNSDSETESTQNNPQSSRSSCVDTSLSSALSNLTLNPKPKREDSSSQRSGDQSSSCSEYEICNSCTSDSSESSSSSSYETSSDDSSTATTSDDDDDENESESSFSDHEYSRLLRGASIGERTH